MKKIKVLLIDDDTILSNMIIDFFKTSSNIEIFKYASNGQDGLSIIEKNTNDFDLIVLDLVMPKKDGIYVINELRIKEIFKKIIVVSSYNSHSIINQVSSLGVDYFILKPFDFIDLEHKIVDIYYNKKTNNQVKCIDDLLHEIGFSSHIKGYLYLKEALNIIKCNKVSNIKLTKDIYPFIASKYETTSINVERSIRHAIETSFNKGNIDTINNLFKNSINYNKSRPSNLEFIMTIYNLI